MSVGYDEYALEILVDEQATTVAVADGSVIEIELESVVVSGRTQEQVVVELVPSLQFIGGGEGPGTSGIPVEDKVILSAVVFWDGIGVAPYAGTRPQGFQRVEWNYPSDKNPADYNEVQDEDVWEFETPDPATL